MAVSTRTIVKILSITIAFYVLLMVAWAARVQIIWLGTAFFLAIALNPLVEQVARVMPKRNRGLAVAGVFVLVFGLLAFLLVALIPPVVRQSTQFGHNLPRYTDELVNGSSWASQQIRDYHLVDRVKESQSQLLHYATSASGSFLTIMQRLFASVAALTTVLVLTVFMLLEGPHWVGAFWQWVPKDRRERARRLADQMYRAVTGYVTGYLLMTASAALLTAILLSVLRVPYAIPLGLLVGVFDWLPLVGATIGAVIVVIVSLFHSTAAAIVMIIFFAVYQQVENHILQPLVQGRTVQMSPLLVLISILIGVGLGGILGAIVAIPVGASVRIVLRDLADRHLAARQ